MNKAKNLLIITVSPFPYSTASANLLRLLSLGLKADGYDVNLLIQRGQSVKTYCNLGPREGEVRGVQFKYCGFIKKPNSSFFKAIDIIKGIFVPFFYLIRNRNKIDFVITYNNYVHEDILNIFACRLLKIKIIHYDVDWYAKDSIVKSVFSLPKWYSYLLKKYYLSKLYNGLLVISKYLENFYLKRSINKEKIYLLPNLVDIENFKNLSVKTKNKTIRIGYLGGAPLLNGVDNLIVAFQIVHNIHPNTELLIVGDVIGDGSQLPILKQIAIDYKVEEKILFTGRVPGDKVPEYLSSCDILVLARKKSVFAQAGFPTKLGEYLISKKPVVMSDVGDITEYFKHKIDLMISKPNDPKSIALNINYLIENPDDMRSVAENGYNWALQNLEYLSATKKVSEFLKQNIC